MNQPGEKIVAYCSTALSAVAMLGISVLVIAAPRIAPGSGAYSDQAKTSAEARMLAEVRALAATVGATAPADQSSASAGHGTTPSADGASLAPPEWSPLEVGAALMQCIAALGPVSAEVIPLAPLRYYDCGTPAPVLKTVNEALQKSLKDPEFVKKQSELGALVVTDARVTPEGHKKFVSDQINTTYAPDGSVVAGGEAVTETVDVWSFARDLNSADPTWLLVGTRSE